MCIDKNQLTMPTDGSATIIQQFLGLSNKTSCIFVAKLSICSKCQKISKFSYKHLLVRYLVKSSSFRSDYIFTKGPNLILTTIWRNLRQNEKKTNVLKITWMRALFRIHCCFFKLSACPESGGDVFVTVATKFPISVMDPLWISVLVGSDFVLRRTKHLDRK